MKSKSGFTLLELLVAMAIFATIALISYSGLASMLNASKTIEIDATRLREIQTAVLFMQRDFLSSVNRPIREEYGSTREALRSSDQGDILIEFSHGGRRNPAGFLRSSLQRVGYGIDDDQNLVRYIWPVLDRSQDTLPAKVELLSNVENLKFRFLDASNSWAESWPPISTNKKLVKLPRAVEITFDLIDWGRIRRLVVLPNG
ncbi:MAG: type II secretion system minor pseudopilin GspJ [Gammaproteobacteria bacterium]